MIHQQSPLERLTHLSLTFKHAVEGTFDTDAFRRRLAKFLTDDEVAAHQRRLQQIIGGQNMPMDRFLVLNIRACETTADWALRALPFDLVADMVPTALRNARDAAMFEKLGARKLAALCAAPSHPG